MMRDIAGKDKGRERSDRTDAQRSGGINPLPHRKQAGGIGGGARGAGQLPTSGRPAIAGDLDKGGRGAIEESAKHGGKG